MAGRLFYLMGASGAGKDCLLRGCRQRLRPQDRCFVAHRYITREPELAGENHVHLSPDEFQARLAGGAFALQWDSNGHRYGIGIEIETWLKCDYDVVLNGSRGYLAEAQRRYPQLIPLLVWVDPAQLRRRLIARGRENSAEIEARLRRAKALAAELPDGCRRIDNSGELDQAIGQLLELIRSEQRADDEMPARCGQPGETGYEITVAGDR